MFVLGWAAGAAAAETGTVSSDVLEAKTGAEALSATPQPGGEVSGFTFVIPGKNGEKECVVRGDTANFLPNGMIEVVNVKAQVFRPGESDIFIQSPKGEFNKATREVRSDQAVQIDTNEMRITGVGLLWDPNTDKAWIYKNVKVKILSKPKGMNL